MKRQLLCELNREVIDIPKMTSLIKFGKSHKFMWLIPMGYESIGLFEYHNDKNIFHYLAEKGVLKLLLPKFFGSESTDILNREGITKTKLIELINSPDNDGFTPAHSAVLKVDPLALQTLLKFGAVIATSEYSEHLVGKTEVIPSPPLEYIFCSEEIAQKFFNGAIANGFTELFTMLCNEHKTIQKQFSKYLSYIIEVVKENNNINSFKVFDIIFENYWTEILKENTEVFHKIMKLFSVLNEVSEHYKGQDVNKVCQLSLDDWSNLLSKGGTAYKRFNSCDEIRKDILNKCANAFLDGTLVGMKLSDLINKGAINAEKFSKLKQFVEQDIVPSDKVVEEQHLNALEDLLGSSKEATHKLQAERIKAQSQKELAEQQALSPSEEATMYKAHSASSGAMPPPIPASKAIDKKTEITSTIVSIKEYADQVVSIATKSENCLTQITTDLGEDYCPLHVFISLAAIPNNFFDKVLRDAAKKLKTVNKGSDVFMREYISIIEGEFMHVNNTSKLDAYGMTCQRDQVNIAKLLLDKSLELGVYTEETDSRFELPIKYNSSKILKYLFTEQESIKINWHYIIFKAIKHANVAAISYYAESDESALQDITDRRGNTNVEERKYNVLNKALSSLVDLSQLERFESKSVQMNNAIKKIFMLCECIKVMINRDKIYYAIDDQHVTKKTWNLLKKLDSATKALSIYQSTIDDQLLNSLEKVMITVKDSVIKGYRDQPNLLLDSRLAIENIESGIEQDDTVSEGTIVSSFSILSGIGEEIREHKCCGLTDYKAVVLSFNDAEYHQDSLHNDVLLGNIEDSI